MLNEYSKSIDRLLSVMDLLREQCPWDKKQTISSLRQQTIEELYELTEAITNNNWNGIKEELGDVLLHIVFYSKIASEQEQFTFEDVIEALCNKLVFRHPHIYEQTKVNDEEEVKRNWEKLKLKEGKKSVLEGVPGSLPAMIKALRLQEKAKHVGFEWDNKEDVMNKVVEELEELKLAVSNKMQNEIEEELGDVLFSIINYARYVHVDPENALEMTNQKFKKRFEYIEAAALSQNVSIDEMSLEQMEALWVKAKLSSI